MNQNDKDRLDLAIEAMSNKTPNDSMVAESASRVWANIEGALAEGASEAAQPADSGTLMLQNCDDYQALLPALIEGTLSKDRALLVEDHSRQCIGCRRALKQLREGGSMTATTSAGATARPVQRASSTPGGSAPSRRWLAIAAVATFAVFSLGLLWATGVLSPSSAEAVGRVAGIEGSLFHVEDDVLKPLVAGDEIRRGQVVSTGGASGATIELADGSVVELRERSRLAVLQGMRDTTLDLDRGSVIVQAAKRSRGNLFVDTDDCRVAVTGTIFSVSHGLKGSRVSVVEGEVRVAQDRHEDILHPGDQVTTHESLQAISVAEDISWSRDFDHYIAVMSELRGLGEELDRSLPVLARRQSTRLLDVAPEQTTLYLGMPNLSGTLMETQRILEERLSASPELSEWWESRFGSLTREEGFQEVLQLLGEAGSFVGEEIVLTAEALEGDEPGLLVYTEVLDSAGLRAWLEEQRAAHGGSGWIFVDDPFNPPATSGDEVLVWIGPELAVLASSAEGMADLATSLVGGSSAFVGTEFHTALAEAYGQSVEWVAGVDVETILIASGDLDGGGGGEVGLEASGFGDARHLVARWNQSGDRPAGEATLSFSGPRQGIASWLAAPSPMGSLDFFTPEARLVTGFVAREPADVVGELLELIGRLDPEALAEFEALQEDGQFDLRSDWASLFGGEFAFGVDGPLLPEPSFALVAEIHDPVKLQLGIAWLITQVNDRAGEQLLRLDEERVGGRSFFAIARTGGASHFHYTFIDNYMVGARSMASVDVALRTYQSGSGLVHTAKFLDLIPPGRYGTFSGLVYEDLGGVLGPLADHFARSQGDLSAEQREQLSEVTGDFPAAVGTLYGEEDRIVMAATYGGPINFATLLSSGGIAEGFSVLEHFGDGLTQAMGGTR